MPKLKRNNSALSSGSFHESIRVFINLHFSEPYQTNSFEEDPRAMVITELNKITRLINLYKVKRQVFNSQSDQDIAADEAVREIVKSVLGFCQTSLDDHHDAEICSLLAGGYQFLALSPEFDVWKEYSESALTYAEKAYHIDPENYRDHYLQRVEDEIKRLKGYKLLCGRADVSVFDAYLEKLNQREHDILHVPFHESVRRYILERWSDMFQINSSEEGEVSTLTLDEFWRQYEARHKGLLSEEKASEDDGVAVSVLAELERVNDLMAFSGQMYCAEFNDKSEKDREARSKILAMLELSIQSCIAFLGHRIHEKACYLLAEGYKFLSHWAENSVAIEASKCSFLYAGLAYQMNASFYQNYYFEVITNIEGYLEIMKTEVVGSLSEEQQVEYVGAIDDYLERLEQRKSELTDHRQGSLKEEESDDEGSKHEESGSSVNASEETFSEVVSRCMIERWSKISEASFDGEGDSRVLNFGKFVRIYDGRMWFHSSFVTSAKTKDARLFVISELEKVISFMMFIDESPCRLKPKNKRDVEAYEAGRGMLKAIIRLCRKLPNYKNDAEMRYLFAEGYKLLSENRDFMSWKKYSENSLMYAEKAFKLDRKYQNYYAKRIAEIRGYLEGWKTYKKYMIDGQEGSSDQKSDELSAEDVEVLDDQSLEESDELSAEDVEVLDGQSLKESDELSVEDVEVLDDHSLEESDELSAERIEVLVNESLERLARKEKEFQKWSRKEKSDNKNDGEEKNASVDVAEEEEAEAVENSPVPQLSNQSSALYGSKPESDEEQSRGKTALQNIADFVRENSP
ncbi:MAG: hypothetical protein ACE365_05705 [Gammaproteobacteria bacterium]